ncbi:MAG: TonB-dependent receptor plug domain-containing protein [Saprospiraceae bacterium]|nr:TonB-dependent receptor plug domain-containing protein [Saprospiraceae bacterium]
MKLRFTLLVLLLPYFLVAQKSMDVSYKNAELESVLQDLETKYGVVFSYTGDLGLEQKVNYSVENTSLEDVLTRLCLELNLNYRNVDSTYIVLTRKPKSQFALCGSFTNDVGEPLSFVSVYCPSSQIGTSADENGTLNWSEVFYENEKIEISYIGYESLILDVLELVQCPTIVLKTKQFSFEEIIVKEYVTSGIEQSVDFDHMILNPGRIQMVPGLTDADVLQMVQLLPGVQSMDESATGIHVRGGTPDQNLILYDGIPVYNGGHFFGMISGFNPSLIEDVNVYRSGFSPKFGGRVASVIDIQSRNTIPDRVTSEAGLNFTHADVSLAVPFFNKRAALVVGARKSYTDIVETPTYRKLSQRVFRKGKLEQVMEEDEPDVIDFGLAFDFNDYNMKLLIEPSERDHISLSFFQIDDKLNFDFTEEEEFATNDKLDQSSTGIGFQWKRNWHEKYSSSINISHTQLSNYYEFSVLDGDDPSVEIQEVQANTIEDNTVVWNNTLLFNTNLHLDFGAQFSDLNVNRRWQVDQEDPEDTELDKNQIFSGFVSLNTSMNNTIKTQVGLRYNYASATQENFLEPRLSIQYVPSPVFQVKAGGGFYRQFMSQVLEFNDLGINQDFWVLSDDDENIPVVLSKNVSLGMIYHPKSFMFEIEGYVKKQEGLTSNLSRFQSGTEAFFESGTGQNWGFDVMLKKKWSTSQSWISYSYSRSQYEADTDDETVSFRAPHDRPHSFQIVHQYHRGKWNISLSWQIASGLVFTESVGLDMEDEDAPPVYNLYNINSERLPISHRLDASLMYKVFQQNGFQGKLGFSLLNMYNRENLMSREYFTEYSEEDDQYELQARDRAMLRFTPNIVFRIKFE